jgi:hypothetical protein
MENNTKIYIGVGAAALVAFLLFRNKAAAQKTGATTTGGTGKTGDKLGDVIRGGLPKPEAPCPEGQTRVEIQCIVAPCPPSMCMPKLPKWEAPSFVDDVITE